MLTISTDENAVDTTGSQLAQQSQDDNGVKCACGYDEVGLYQYNVMIFMRVEIVIIFKTSCDLSALLPSSDEL